MAKPPQKRQPRDARDPHVKGVAAAVQPASRAKLFVPGLIALVVAVAATLMLTLQHLAGMSLPGCGPSSACAGIFKTAWGHLPGVMYPVSSIGLAYFAAMLVGWLGWSAAIATRLVWLVRFGALVSVIYLFVIATGGHLCHYCLITHATNLIFWLIVETARPKSAISAQATGALAALAIVFLGLTAALATTEFVRNRQVAADEAAKQAKSAQEIIQKSGGANATTPILPNNNVGPPRPNFTATVDGPPRPEPADTRPAFTGRYRIGPRNAPIRIVMFSDFQCTDCRAIEMQARQIVASRTDVSVSHKHFPMCKDCNRMMGNSNMHPNACWAARASEAAAILKGEAGFWEMHHWLFDVGGSFTDASFPGDLQRMGYDPQQFIAVMQSPATLEPVKADIDEAISLGLNFTPMIFVNGVELKGFTAPNALINTVNQVAASNPQPGSPEDDNPPRAIDKYVDDWKQARVRMMPADIAAFPRGPEDAPINITVWSDLQLPATAEFNFALNKLIEGGAKVRYTYRHFPFNQACNPNVQRTQHPHACRAAQALEAAGRVGGADAYWKMYEWMMNHHSTFSEAELQKQVLIQKLDVVKFNEAIANPEVAAAIADDVQAGVTMSVGQMPHGIPTIVVNGRIIPRWKLEGADVLGKILEEAAAGR